LLTDDINDARRYAAELEQFNQARKEQQALMQEQAQAIIDTQSVETDKFALSLHNAWHH
jgi:single-stranded-DNA-specific exonuclease